MLDVRVISIGTLAANPLWDEREPVRTGHTTTSLVRAGDAVILVDPGLPAQILAARLGERANLTPDDITHVFLTSFQPDGRRGLTGFERAEWLVHQPERESVGVPMAQSLAAFAQLAQESGGRLPEDQQIISDILEQDIAILQRCQAAPDQIAPGVDLFPLPGVTPGLCGLLVSTPNQTILICGDAISTPDHLAEGKVLPTCSDRAKALDSFKEAVEIADAMVLGRDNFVINPAQRPF